MKPADVSAPPIWRRIADDLVAAIERGDHATGTILPSAVEIARRYGVHRHTARQAFQHLEVLGLVAVTRGLGARVTGARLPYRIGRRVSFRENLGPLGLTVEGSIVRAYLTCGAADVAQRLGAPPDATLWRVRTLNRAAGAPISTAVHHVDATRFPDFGPALESAGASITAAFRKLGVPHYMRGSTRIRARIASDQEAQLLRIPANAPVLASDGLDVDPAGVPLHLAETAFAADRLEFVIDASDAG